MKHLRLLAVVGVLVALSGCGGEDDVREWIEHTGALQTNVVRQVDSAPYRKEQHEAFKAYFSELAEMALLLKGEADAVKALNAVAQKSDLEDVCRKVLIPKATWQNMVQRCTKNRFFLCAEEVRAYPDMIAVLREKLSPDQRR